jgi:hypothetical protein
MKKIFLILLVIAFSGFRITSINSGLIAYFPIDANTSSVLDDKLSNNDFVGYGNPYITNGGAYTNGSSSYYGVVDPVAIKKLTNKLSVSFWGKRSTTSSQCFLAAIDSAAAVNVWNVQNTGGGQWQMIIISPPSTITGLASTTSSWSSANVWRHFVATYDGSESTASNRIKLYVNGVNIAGTMTSTIPTSLNNPQNSTLRYGRGIAYLGTAYMKFARVYDRPLTPVEVKEIYVSEYNKINQTH